MIVSFILYELGYATNLPPTQRFDHRIIDTVTKTMRWRSFRNGSKTYVDAFQKSLPSHHHVYLSTPVRRVHRLSTGDVSLEFTDGRPTQTYDHVVLAVHANQALSLLGDGASSLEQAVLGSFHTSKNVCVLHSDTSVSCTALHLKKHSSKPLHISSNRKYLTLAPPQAPISPGGLELLPGRGPARSHKTTGSPRRIRQALSNPVIQDLHHL